ALDSHRAAVKLHQGLHDGQPEPQPAVAARDRRITLTKTVEHVRQEIRGNTYTAVLDNDLDVGVDSLQHDLDPAARGRELHRVREEVPQHLLQPVGIAAPPADAGIEQLLNPDLLGVRALSDRLDGAVDHFVELQGLDFEMDLSRNDPAHVQQVVDDLRLC